MHIIPTDGGTVEVLDSIHSIPAKRYTAFNVKSLDHSAVGSDMRAAMEHLGRLKLFLEGGNTEAGLGEFNNYVLCLNQVRNTGADALATVVHSINGKVVPTAADGDYSSVADQLALILTQAQVEEAVEHVRGKLTRR